MRGWILLGLGASVFYYLATETNKLDGLMAQKDAFQQKIERKFDAISGTKFIKIDKETSQSQLKKKIAHRMSTEELSALDDILKSQNSIQTFEDEYCDGLALKHASLSQDNLQYLCDKLK